MTKIQVVIECEDDPRRNESVIFEKYGNTWKRGKSFVQHGQLLTIWANLGNKLKICSYMDTKYFLVTRSGLKPIDKRNA